MLFTTVSAIFLASGVLATPAKIRKHTDPNTGLVWISNNSSLPKIMLYNTGDGTIISGSTFGRLDNLNYGGGIGRLTPESLIAAVPEVLSIAQIAVVNFTGGSAGPGSANANADQYLNISKDATTRLCNPGTDIIGAVMIHGTNTLAETAFGVDITLNCSSPFVTTGSMRPNSALSAEGPLNFYDAVRIAVHPEARDRGGMLAFNDHVVSAFYATKTNGNAVTTFVDNERGFIAQILGGQPYFYNSPSLPKARPYFDPYAIDYNRSIPLVPILYTHQGFDAQLIYDAVANGAKGIVLMGSGAGAISTAATAAANNVSSQGIIVVDSLRPSYGASIPPPLPGAM
ncbi:hypothetical protein IFR05_014819 [Cadophora sp. M221]|nr:hypothetical protein IFR05_014819 [Cadophora sp. M221]